MARINLKGMGVALITPFKEDKTIDFDALARLLEYQIKNGVDYLVVLGTTAETATLSADEKRQVRDFIVERVAERVPLVIGIGGNNTMALVEELKTSDLSPFSAVLSVVPYYNKPSQEGIYQHYKAIAEASPIPVILYNVPGRTCVNMTAETTLRLARLRQHHRHQRSIGQHHPDGRHHQKQARRLYGDFRRRRHHIPSDYTWCSRSHLRYRQRIPQGIFTHGAIGSRRRLCPRLDNPSSIHRAFQPPLCRWQSGWSQVPAQCHGIYRKRTSSPLGTHQNHHLRTDSPSIRQFKLTETVGKVKDIHYLCASK